MGGGGRVVVEDNGGWWSVFSNAFLNFATPLTSIIKVAREPFKKRKKLKIMRGGGRKYLCSLCSCSHQITFIPKCVLQIFRYYLDQKWYHVLSKHFYINECRKNQQQNENKIKNEKRKTENSAKRKLKLK